MFWKCTLWIQVTFSFILKKHISDLTVNQDMDTESCFLQHQSILNCFTTRLMFSYTPHLMWIRIDQFYFTLFYCVAKTEQPPCQEHVGMFGVNAAFRRRVIHISCIQSIHWYCIYWARQLFRNTYMIDLGTLKRPDQKRHLSTSKSSYYSSSLNTNFNFLYFWLYCILIRSLLIHLHQWLLISSVK